MPRPSSRQAALLLLALTLPGLPRLTHAQTTQPAAPPLPLVTNPASTPADAAVSDSLAPLASRVPSSVLFYAGWLGHNNLPPEFNDTSFAQLLASLDLPAWSRDQLPNLLPPQARDNPVAQQALELLRAIAEYAWNNKAAVYSLGEGVNDQLSDAPHLCFLIEFPDRQSADDAERDIQSRITAIIGGEVIPNVALYRKENTLAFTVNDGAAAGSPLDPLKSSLSRDEKFRAAASQALPNVTGLALFQDLSRTWELLDEQRGGDQEYQRNMRISGLRHATSLFLSAGFDAKDYLSTLHLSVAPPPPPPPPSTQPAREEDIRGLLGFFSSPRPVDERLYAGVPRSALSMNSMSFDLADLFARIKTEGDIVRPGFADRADAWVNVVAGALGVNVNDFTSNIGPDFALYSLPTAAGKPSYDYLLLTQPRDPAKADQQLLGLAKGLQRLVLTQRPDLPKLTVDRADVAGLTFTTLDNGLLSPSWAIKNGFLVIAPSRTVLAHALSEMDKGSIIDVLEFTQLRSRLHAPAGASFGYADLPKSLSQMYANWIYTADRAGRRIPPPLKLLPIPGGLDLEKHTTPAVSATWTTNGDLVFRTISPYPGSELLSATFGLLAGPNSLPLKLPQLRDRLQQQSRPPSPPSPPTTPSTQK